MLILLVDDQALTCLATKGSLLEASFSMVEKAAHEDLAGLVNKLEPDIVLIDIHLPDMDGIIARQQIKRDRSATCILALTRHHSHEKVAVEMLDASANGYHLKEIKPQKLIYTVKQLSEKDNYLESKLTGKLFQMLDGEGSEITVTERELDVLKLMEAGATNKEIAEKLHLSLGSIRNTLQAIFYKLLVTDRTSAVAKAIRLRWI